MNVIVLGADGMLGTDLMAACRAAGTAVQGLDLPDVDICDYDSIAAQVPVCDCLINCAAYTDVDGAESHADQAFAVNAEGPANIARWCHRKDIKLIHISTDYVFDGRKGRSYTEWNQPNPISVYGASKLAGEKAVRAEGCAYFIVRTQSLFGVHGHNFVKAVMGRLARGKNLRVVNDQVSCPTYTMHLAEALLRLLPLERDGIVHLSARGSCSWYDFAVAIVKRVQPDAVVEPIPSTQMERPAERPACSVLDNWRYRMWTAHRMPTWQEGLEAYLKEEGN
jgi:dTDP-4-dehydrorhamnose reductase